MKGTTVLKVPLKFLKRVAPVAKIPKLIAMKLSTCSTVSPPTIRLR